MQSFRDIEVNGNFKTETVVQRHDERVYVRQIVTLALTGEAISERLVILTENQARAVANFFNQ